MSNRKSPTFTPVELEFMQILWDAGDLSTDELQEALSLQGRDLADGSIRKVLSILMEKGHVSRLKEGRGYRYKAVTVQDRAQETIIHDIVDRAFRGSAPGLVAALLDTRSVNPKELTEIKKLIAEYEKGEKK